MEENNFVKDVDNHVTEIFIIDWRFGRDDSVQNADDDVYELEVLSEILDAIRVVSKVSVRSFKRRVKIRNGGVLKAIVRQEIHVVNCITKEV